MASFSNYYGHGTIMRVEFSALLDGLFLCNALELRELDIEFDAKVVVTAILAKETPSWAYIQVLRRCLA